MKLSENLKVLLIDDDPAFHKKFRLSFGDTFEIEGALDEEHARTKIQSQQFDLLLLDLDLSGNNDFERGLDFIQPLQMEAPETPIIVVTRDGRVESAVRAMKLGAKYFLWKGKFDSRQWEKQMRETVRESRLKRKDEALRTLVNTIQEASKEGNFFVSSSSQLQALKKQLAKLSEYPKITVLILGETGVGKEVAARYLHQNGQRLKQPFIAVNLSALSPSTLESELFGHRKGAFTDAKTDLVGRFEQANGGVLFLDEIGEINQDIQVKLLRFLDDKIIRPLGASKDIKLDVQIVAATNKDLAAEVEAGRFRSDFYQRLKNFEVRIPPLRERREDIFPIMNFYARTDIRQALEPDVEQRLLAYDWPGNVRELRNTLESMLLKAEIQEKKLVSMDCLPIEIQHFYGSGNPSLENGEPTVKEGSVEWAKAIAELNEIERALRQAGGRKAEAAQLIGLRNDQDLRYRINKYNEQYPDLLLRYPTICDRYKLVHQ